MKQVFDLFSKSTAVRNGGLFRMVEPDDMKQVFDLFSKSTAVRNGGLFRMVEPDEKTLVALGYEEGESFDDDSVAALVVIEEEWDNMTTYAGSGVGVAQAINKLSKDIDSEFENSDNYPEWTRFNAKLYQLKLRSQLRRDDNVERVEVLDEAQ